MDLSRLRWLRTRLAITGLLVVCSFLWFLSELTQDPLVRWVTVVDWLLEIVLLWLAVCFLTSVTWLRQRTAVYLSAVAGVFCLFVDHFLVHNMYAGATYRMAAAALATGTGIVGLANAWLLAKVFKKANGREVRLGAVVLCSLAVLLAAFGDRVLPAVDRWHPFGR